MAYPLKPYVEVLTPNVIVLSWPKSSSKFFCPILWRQLDPSELFGQPSIWQE